MLEHYSNEIKDVKEAGFEISVVIGGGNIFRGVRGATEGMDRVQGDYMGMLATMINSMALQDALERKDIHTRLMSAIRMEEIAEPYIRRRAIRHLEKGRVVLSGSGTGNPYCTTDTAASLRAIEIEADVILKGTKVDGIYDKDPETHDDAVKFNKITGDEVLRRQLNVMDLTAFTLCRDNRTPFIDKLGFKQLDVGNLISTGNVDGLVTITQTQPIAVTFSLPEQDLQQLLERLHLEQALQVQVYGVNEKLLGEGALLAVDNQIDVSTGTVRIKASLPNEDNALYPNQFARISVLLGTQKGLLIPEEAVQIGARGAYVYVVDEDNKVQPQVLELGLRSAGQVLVLDGVEKGAQVVTEEIGRASCRERVEN